VRRQHQHLVTVTSSAWKARNSACVPPLAMTMSSGSAAMWFSRASFSTNAWRSARVPRWSG